MIDKIPTRFDSQNIGFLLLCLGGLVSLYIIGILPLQMEAKDLNRRIPVLKQKASDQLQLETMLAAIEQEKSIHDHDYNLPKVAVSHLPEDKTDKILPDFESVAKKSKMTILEVSPQFKKTANIKKLVISAQVQGDFNQMRAFLFNLLKLSYVSQVNDIEIKTSGELLQCNLTYSVNLS